MRDELDIQRVITEYAWAIDNGDWALLKSVFTDDAHLDYSSAGGPAGPRNEILLWLEQSLSVVPAIQHLVSNFQIDLSEDRAKVRAMFWCAARLPGMDDLFSAGGYYNEDFVRTAAGWKIERLVEDSRWTKSQTVPD